MRLFVFTRLFVSWICLLFVLVTAHSRARSPLNYLTFVENAKIHTPTHRVHAFSHFDLTFKLHDGRQQVKLRLEPNHDILAEDASVDYLDAEGNVRHTEKIDRSAHKVFLGTTWLLDSLGEWMEVGSSRVVIQRDGTSPLFEGVFTMFNDPHHVQMGSNYMATKHELDPHMEGHWDEHMTVFRDSDISTKWDLKRDLSARTCQADSLSFNNNPSHPIFNRVVKREVGSWGESWGITPLTSLLGKRQIDTTSGGNSATTNLTLSIGSTSGCPTTRKVALVGVATDCTYIASFNSTQTARENIITQFNSASEIYQKSFNITLGLERMTLSEAACPATAPASAAWNLPCNSNATITDRLNLFSSWRGEQTGGSAYWTLLSNCSTGPEIGLSWLGQLCTSGSSTSTSNGTSETVAGANVVVRTSTEWQVIAHESGHTFGAVHDCDTETCADSNVVNSQQCCPLSSSTCNADGQYIMNPSSNSGESAFSPCTIGNICSAMGKNSVNSSCLSNNKDITTVTGSECGNGIVETGEECDCGGTEGCGDDTCCDPTTCKFTSGSVCDDSNDACCTSCQFAANGTVCRASSGVCDPAEYCSGQNATCPPDETATDGTKCGNSTSNLQCASGQCTSRDLQCENLMSSYTSDNDTYACNSETCIVECASPSFGSGVCYSMQQNFLDGTPCGGDGRCSNGNCTGDSLGGEVKSWIDDHKTMVIALSSVIGALVLFSIVGCLWRRCRTPKPKRKRPIPPRARRAVPPMQQQPGWTPQEFGLPPPVYTGQNGGNGYQQIGGYPGYRGPPPEYGSHPEFGGRSAVRYG